MSHRGLSFDQMFAPLNGSLINMLNRLVANDAIHNKMMVDLKDDKSVLRRLVTKEKSARLLTELLSSSTSQLERRAFSGGVNQS